MFANPIVAMTIRLICSALLGGAMCCAASAQASAGASARVLRAVSGLPLHFEPNRGQVHPSIRYVAQTPQHRVLLTSDTASIALASSDPKRKSGLRLRWVGADPWASVTGEQPMAGSSHYFAGSSTHTDIPHHARVRFHRIYPGIDLVYYGNPRQLEFDLVVAAGVDPSIVRFAIDGARSETIEASGDLVMETAAGPVRQSRPHVYQDAGGQRVTVDSRYVRRDDGHFGIALGAYDKAESLVIDPVISYADHIGGHGNGAAIAVDSDGNAYVTGWIDQASGGGDFPVISAYDRSIGRSDIDVFVQKYNATGTALIYSTYLGGSKGVDKGVAIAVDRAGNAYIAGTTTSTDFPVTTAPYQTAMSNGGGFVAKLGPSGNALVYSTYVRHATPTSIALDSGNNAYVAGAAASGFVTTGGALQPTSRSLSQTNGFVLKLNPTGATATYATFLGGSGADRINGIAVDPYGHAYVTGGTTSTDFPVLNAWRSSSGGANDAFVAKLVPAGNALAYSTYLGGSQDDYANAIAVDGRGSAYVTGATASFDFPIRNPFQPVKGGGGTLSPIDNAFVTKLTPAGNDLVYSSFLGGDGCLDAQGIAHCLFYARPVDTGTSIAVDAKGHAYVGGGTTSILFPRIDSHGGPIASNGAAGFVAKVSVGGAALLYSTLLGGEAGDSYDYVMGLALDPAGNLYGVTNYSAFPTTSTTAATTGNVVFKLAAASKSVTLATSVNPMFAGDNVVLTANISARSDTALVSFFDGSTEIGIEFAPFGTATISRQLKAGIHALTAVYRDGSDEAESDTVYQVVNPSSVCR